MAPTPTPSALRVDWLTSEAGLPLVQTAGRLGLSACPGRADLGGNPDTDLKHLRGLGIKVVVTLVGDREIEYYGSYGLRGAVRENGLQSIHFPIVDAAPPDDADAARDLCRDILGWLGEGHDALVHCIGGWGRTGTIASCLLVHEGYAPARAIAEVRRARSPRCVESRAQERFVESYAAFQTRFERIYALLPRAEVAASLTGGPAARTLTPAAARQLDLVSAAALRGRLAELAPATQAEQVILSGERPREATPLHRAQRIDRAFALEPGDGDAKTLSLRPLPLEQAVR